MISLDGRSLTCEKLHAIAGGVTVNLADGARRRMQANADSVPDGPSVLEAKRRVLVGPASQHLSPDELCRAFVRSHCAGVGEPFSDEVVRAAIAARANVLAGGVTGCRPEAAEVLVAMLNHQVHPTVPCQGSVGAAGDLAPLAHIAWVACGYGGQHEALPEFSPEPKEALALINGCSVTTALAAQAVVRAQRVLDNAVAVTAMTMEVVQADWGAVDSRPLVARGHPGAVAIAERLRELLDGSTQVVRGREPDAFSVRCSATVLGAAYEALEQAKTVVERELNGAGDNPLLFDGEWVEGGNFHGAPIGLAMDALKIALTHVATLSERRTFRLTYGHLSRGLPSFLVPGTGLNSGFMLAQYTAASLASECKGLSHPATVDVIPTVQHHEDHVSMGPIAARMALEVLECVADILAIEAVLAAQGLDFRRRGLAWDADGHRVPAPTVDLAPRVEQLWSTVRESIDFWDDDGVLHPVLARAGQLVRQGSLTTQSGPW